jgi:Protein of unknown function (DUF1553)
VAGTLNLARPEASFAKEFKVSELRNNGPEAKKLDEQGRASVQRSVYLPLLRGLTPRALEVFDFAEQGMVTGQRDATTVAPQSLYLLNDAFVRRQALTLAEKLLAQADSDEAARVRQAYRLTLGRPATDQEVERATSYLTGYASAAGELLAAAKDAKPASTAETADASPPAATGNAAVAANPDDIERSEPPPKEEQIQPSSPQAAAWASFCQALLGSAEFRYLK